MGVEGVGSLKKGRVKKEIRVFVESDFTLVRTTTRLPLNFHIVR